MSYQDFRSLGERVGGVIDDKKKTFSIQRGAHTIVAGFQQLKNSVLLKMECRTRPLPKVRLRKENSTDRVGKRIGLNRELQTRDAVFDENVYTESNAADEAVLKLLAREQVRAAALLLLKNGHPQVDFGKAGVQIQSSGSNSSVVFNLEGFNEAAGALTLIADNLPDYADWETQSAWLTGGTFIAIGSVAGLIALLVFTAVVSGTYRTLEWAPWLVGWGFGAGAWLLWLPVCGRLVRGRSDAMRNFLISMIVLMAGLPLGGGGAVVFANGYWDTSPAVPHQTVVTRKWTTRSKNSTNYHTEVRGWRAGETLKFSGYSYYHSKQVGTPALVITRGGAFGWEWIESYS